MTSAGESGPTPRAPDRPLPLDELTWHFDRHQVPESGRRLVLEVLDGEPVRRVGGGGRSVVVRYASRKMGRVIQAESRNVELVFLEQCEHDPNVLFFFCQPTRLSVRIIDAKERTRPITDYPGLPRPPRERWLLLRRSASRCPCWRSRSPLRAVLSGRARGGPGRLPSRPRPTSVSGTGCSPRRLLTASGSATSATSATSSMATARIQSGRGRLLTSSVVPARCAFTSCWPTPAPIRRSCGGSWPTAALRPTCSRSCASTSTRVGSMRPTS